MSRSEAAVFRIYYIRILAIIVVIFLSAGCSIPRSQLALQSPLDEFRSALVGSPWESELLPDNERLEVFSSSISQMENLIAQCMREAGFDYQPAPEAHQLTLADGSWRPNDRDWVAQFGYDGWGLTSVQQANSPGWSRGINPSQRLANNTLTESEMLAWNQAFYGHIFTVINALRAGESTEFSLGELHANPTRENVGCSGWAEAMIVPNDNQLTDIRLEFAPLFAALSDMKFALANEISSADRDWANCMADSAFPNFERQIDAREFANERKAEFDLSYDGTDTPERQRLREQLVELALADFDCRIATDFDGHQTERRIAAETRFVNDHRTELEALRSAVEQQ